MTPPIDLARVATAGSVDDGKSTLIGRLLLDSGAIHEDQLHEVERASAQRGSSAIDLSLFTDGLAAERARQITVDVAYRYFTTARRRFAIADVPGHAEYMRNMLTGVSTAQVVLVLVDARRGAVPLSRRHLLACSLLDVDHTLVVVNKMDAVGYEQRAFEAVVTQVSALAQRLSIRDLQFMPVSALAGDMVVRRGDRLSWYGGRPLLDYLEHVDVSASRTARGVRLPIQCVLPHDADGVCFAGLLESGTVRVGDPVVVQPSGEHARILEVVVAGDPLPEARAGQSIAVTLTDSVHAWRGSLITSPENPPTIASRLDAMVCWFVAPPLESGRSYLLKQTTRTTRAVIADVHYRRSLDTFDRESTERLDANDVGCVRVHTEAPLAFDPYARDRATGAFILIDESTHATAGAGMIVGGPDTGRP